MSDLYPIKASFWKSFIEYFKLYIHELKLEGQVLYKVIKFPDYQDEEVHFQVVDKGVSLKMTLEQLIADNMLHGFSKREIAALSELRYKSRQDLIIDSIALDEEETEENYLRVTDLKNSFEIKKTAKELLADQKTLSRFKLDDVIRIAYLAGSECTHASKFAE